MGESFGNRLKDNYENRYRYNLTRRTYTVMRLDGKAFHSYTKKAKCSKPFDWDLMGAMDKTALGLCNEIMGAQIAYIQSDEITILLTDFGNLQTQSWFDGNLQKMCSVSASLATVEFNKNRLEQFFNKQKLDDLIINKSKDFVWGSFDSRVWTFSDPYEVENAFIWRQLDAERNSLQMLARSAFSHKELVNKKSSDMHDMLHSKSINWNDLPAGAKRGRTVIKNEFGKFVIDTTPPIFTKDRDYLRSKIPLIPNWETAPQKTISNTEGISCEN